MPKLYSGKSLGSIESFTFTAISSSVTWYNSWNILFLAGLVRELARKEGSFSKHEVRVCLLVLFYFVHNGCMSLLILVLLYRDTGYFPP